MAGVNKVILVGNLGKDPEVRTLDNGTKVGSFSLATTESYKDKNTGERKDLTEWHNIVVWRALADISERYLQKGSQVYIEGKIQTRSYEQDGVTKYRTEIVANNMTMLGRAGEGSTHSAAPSSEASSQPSPELASTDESSDDLPF